MGSCLCCPAREEEERGRPLLARVPSILLYGCTTLEEHQERVDRLVQKSSKLYGLEGLKFAGFEFRQTPSRDGQDVQSSTENVLKLHHTDSNTVISEENLRQFIANGRMYDIVTRLCQEAVQESMIQEFDLDWVVVCDSEEESGAANPIHALVGRQMQESALTQSASVERANGTLVISPGIGETRAGIFSRRHLLTSGIEVSTARTWIHQARLRGMGIVLLDPNARGKRHFNTVFGKSLTIFQNATHLGLEGPYYVLAHSASGGMLVRNLLFDMGHRKQLLSQIYAIAFTDSTHNIQWAKKDDDLKEFLQSEACLYIRSNSVRDLGGESDEEQIKRKSCGSVAATDHWWRHRFGDIQTLWAGTSSHVLMNHAAKDVIWHHFDNRNLSRQFNGVLT